MGSEDRDDFWRVNALNVFVGVAFIILTIRATAYLAPYGGYFTWGSLLYGDPEGIKWYAIAIRYSIPAIAGFLIGSIVKENPEGTAASAGFLSSFILTWPALIAWDRFAPPEMLSRQGAFILVWILYFASFTYAALFGARLHLAFSKWKSATSAGKSLQAFSADLLGGATVKSLLLAAASAALSKLVERAFSQ